VTAPTPAEIEAALETCSGLLDPSRPLLVVSLHNSLLHAEPHRYVAVESPSARSFLLTGRSTHTSVAYDIQRKKRVFIKDSWRIVAADTMMEGQVCQMLNRGKVKNVPSCVDFCDVGEDRYHQTQTQNFFYAPRVPRVLRYLIPVLRHHRLILDNVDNKLENFGSSCELARAVRAAIVGTKPLCFVLRF